MTVPACEVVIGDLILREHRWRPVTHTQTEGGRTTLFYGQGHDDYWESTLGGWSTSKANARVRVKRAAA